MAECVVDSRLTLDLVRLSNDKHIDFMTKAAGPVDI